MIVEIQENNLDLQNHQGQENFKNEILHFQKVLKEFKIPFESIVRQSPKDIEEREDIINIVKALIKSEDLNKALFQNKQIPVKQLKKLILVNKKIIVYHYNYIIALAIILAGDYVYLKDYIKGYWNRQL